MTKYTKIWQANRSWLDAAERDGLKIDWDSEPVDCGSSDDWHAACETAEVGPEDYELGFAVLLSPRDGDEVLCPGDIVVTTGPGSDVVFLRKN